MKTIQWFLLHTRCHFQPLVTFGHSWLEMAPRESQKPFHFLHTSDGKQILISSFLHGFLNCSENEVTKKSSLFTSRDCNYPEILIPGYQVLKCPNTRVSGTGNGYPKIAWLLIKWSTSKHIVNFLHMLLPSSCVYSVNSPKWYIFFPFGYHFVTPMKLWYD